MNTKREKQALPPECCPICHQPVYGLGPLDVVFHVECVLKQWSELPGNEELKKYLQEEEQRRKLNS